MFMVIISIDNFSQYVVFVVVKNPPTDAGDLGLIPGSGRSPGEGNGNPLQYLCLENPLDGGAWLQPMGSQRVGHH